MRSSNYSAQSVNLRLRAHKLYNSKMSEKDKARRLNMEINNGRLAMIGIFGFLSADAIPGSVPFLDNLAQPYDGNVMIPFEGQFSLLG